MDEIASQRRLRQASIWAAIHRRVPSACCSIADLARGFREAIGQRLMSLSRTRARERGVRSVQTVLEDGDPASTILRLAKGLHVDVLFLGSRGLGDASGLYVGSVSHEVAHLAECTCVW